MSKKKRSLKETDLDLQNAINIARRYLDVEGDKAKRAGKRIDRARLQIRQQQPLDQAKIIPKIPRKLDSKTRRSLLLTAKRLEEVSKICKSPLERKIFDLALNRNETGSKPQDVKEVCAKFAKFKELGINLRHIVEAIPPEGRWRSLTSEKREAVWRAKRIWETYSHSPLEPNSEEFKDFVDQIWAHAGGDSGENWPPAINWVFKQNP